MNFRHRIAQFFYGRYLSYGVDLLTKILAGVCIALAIINVLIGSIFIYTVQTALFIFMFYRLFSRKIFKRQEENRKAQSFFNKMKASVDLRKRMHADRQTHVYKKCPHCSVMLRLPKRRGEHTVNCPRCKNNFSVKVK